MSSFGFRWTKVVLRLLSQLHICYCHRCICPPNEFVACGADFIFRRFPTKLVPEFADGLFYEFNTHSFHLARTRRLSISLLR